MTLESICPSATQTLMEADHEKVNLRNCLIN